MTSMSRSEYRREERRVNESPFRETKWDQHLDSLLTDLNDSVGPAAGRTGTVPLSSRSVVPAGGQGVVTESRGIPGSGDFHERREYVTPDQKTRVVEEHIERTARGGDGSQMVQKQTYKSSYSSDDATQPRAVQSDASRMKQNIHELDNLLDDLDHARKKPESNGVATGSRATFDGPGSTSTPYRQTNIHKTTTTTKYAGSEPSDPSSLTPGDLVARGVGGPSHSPSPNPLAGIDLNLAPELTEAPQPGTTRVTRYEYRSSNRREVSPQPPAARPAALPAAEPTKAYSERREYTSSRTNTLERPADSTVSYNVYSTDGAVPVPPQVPQVPGGTTTINYHIYNYGTLGPDGETLPRSVPGTPGLLPRNETNTRTTTNVEYYNSSGGQPAPQSAPHRSPPPGADTTVSRSYLYEQHSSQPQPQPANNLSSTSTNITRHHTHTDGRPGSPYDGQYPKFPVDEPVGAFHSRTTTVTTERSQTHGSPFPGRRSPSPSARRPRDDGPKMPFPGAPQRPVDQIEAPRRVDELMAQVPDTPQDGTYPHGPRRREVNGSGKTHNIQFTVHESEPLLDQQTKVTLDAHSGAVVPSKPVTGPPVYYPPGVEELKPTGHSETMMQSHESRGKGKYKAGYKAKGKYKAKGGAKERHAEGGAVIPVCLPLCCGAACTVM